MYGAKATSNDTLLRVAPLRQGALNRTAPWPLEYFSVQSIYFRDSVINEGLEAKIECAANSQDTVVGRYCRL